MEVPFAMPDIDQQDKKGVADVLDSQWLTGGQKTVEFEKKFAEYIGVKYAVAVNSCTAALHLAMRALNIGQGDEVIVPTMTFAATANAPIFCGAKPVFADIDEKTFNISPESVKERITSKTRAIIPVHIAGQPCELREILQIAMDHNLFVVEDCAHSLGATYQGFQTGRLSVAGCFSFYASKNITTGGEGGMITTNDGELAKYVRLMRTHCATKGVWERNQSASWEYDIVDLGYNYRMSEMAASLGISQLKRVDQMNERRAEVSEYYTERLRDISGIITPKLAENRTSSYHLYIIRVVEKKFGMSRDELFKGLAEVGIECSVHYKPLHMMSFYSQKYGYKVGDYPVAERVYSEILSLPLFSKMSDEQVEYVVEQIEGLVK